MFGFAELRFGSSRRRRRNVANKFEFMLVTAILVGSGDSCYSHDPAKNLKIRISLFCISLVNESIGR